jgi:hypothetical protein
MKILAGRFLQGICQVFFIIRLEEYEHQVLSRMFTEKMQSISASQIRSGYAGREQEDFHAKPCNITFTHPGDRYNPQASSSKWFWPI